MVVTVQEALYESFNYIVVIVQEALYESTSYIVVTIQEALYESTNYIVVTLQEALYESTNYIVVTVQEALYESTNYIVVTVQEAAPNDHDGRQSRGKEHRQNLRIRSFTLHCFFKGRLFKYYFFSISLKIYFLEFGSKETFFGTENRFIWILNILRFVFITSAIIKVYRSRTNLIKYIYL